MRIAIDARELAGKPTGVGRYLRQLLLAWNEMPAAAAHEFVLCGTAYIIALALFHGIVPHMEPVRMDEVPGVP